MDEEAAPAKRVVKNKDRNRNPLHGPQVEIKGQHRVVKMGELRPNTWNYNTQSETVFNKLVTSMRRHGFTKPIIGRTVPGVTGWEIIDGEHRWRAGQILGLTEVPLIDLGEMADSAAKELTIILNELGGKPDDVRLGDLLRDINQLVPLEEIVQVMPFAESELDTLMGAMSFDLDSLSGADPRPPEAKEERDASPMKSSKKVLQLRWGGLVAYDVEKAIQAAQAQEGFATGEDAVLAALRWFLQTFNQKPSQESK